MRKTTMKGLASFGLGALMLLDGSAGGLAAPSTYVDLGFSRDSGILEVAAACGPRGCAAVRRPPAARLPGSPAGRRRRGRTAWSRWVRPYRWPVGGAIAAGAAIGFVVAATAVAWAPPPPQPGLCWYYTDPSQRQGFWDVCP